MHAQVFLSRCHCKELRDLKSIRGTRRKQLPRCGHSKVECKEGGMYVPSDSFNGMSPERKAAHAMVSFFTFVAVRIVLAQLEGSGRDSLGSYDSKASKDLHELLEEMPLREGDGWIAALMKKNEMLGVRVMEVREAYAKQDFEWDHFQRLSSKVLQEGNVKLMRQHAEHAFRKAYESQKD